MADDPKAADPKAKDDKPAGPPRPKAAKVGPDTALYPGGAYIRGGFAAEDDKHYGGTVVNCDGEVLAEFADDEENDGRPKDRPADPRVKPRTLEQMAPPKPVAPPQAGPAKKGG